MKRWRLVGTIHYEVDNRWTNFFLGIVGPPAHHLLGVEGVEGAEGPRFRKLSPQEIEDYLTNL